jgi:hypothetical protein
MNNEISQEAQASIAKLNQRKARDRLHRDGGDSISAMRRRIQAFAIERGIPSATIAKLMKGRMTTLQIMRFCKEYQVNADWLMAGDLRGLLDTVKRRKPSGADEQTREAQEKEFVRLMRLVEPRLYPDLLTQLRKQLEGA